ncbi:archaeosortase/exosortase family protein [Cyanobium sp. FGCU-6]|jgi:cyanoexosortase A|nr:archaeosortase/exosortase family protein [Cyanobium sp. FGCU6]
MTLRRRLNGWIDSLPAPFAAQIPRIPPATHRNLWLLLAALVAIQSLTVFSASQPSNTSVFALLIWGGALICIEDQLDTLTPRPGRFGLLVGTVLLVWVVLRSSVIMHWDGLLFVLAPLSGLALGLLCMPEHQVLSRFRDALLCLMLMPGFALLMRLLPEEPISLFTARIAAIWVGALGYTTLVRGRNVYLPGGGVEVLGACNGLDMMAQIFCVAVIFLLAFRIRSIKSRFVILLVAPLIGMIANSIRIALLAVITSYGHGHGSTVFDFWHKDTGSLVFSGVAVFLFGLVYMHLLERELPPLPDRGDS